MTFREDTEANALEIAVREGIVARTIEIDPGTLVDVDESGSVIAIEVLNPRRVWPVGEILARFDFSPEDGELLRSLRPEPHLSFAAPPPLVAA